MTQNKGLSLEKINDNDVFIDPDNVFWGINKASRDANAVLPRELISLYEKSKDSCDREMKDFRFSKDLTAIYINPTDLCDADCPYCYVPKKTRKNGRSMTETELVSILNKIYKHFEKVGRKQVIIFHASEPLLVKEMLFKVISRFQHKFYFGIQTNTLSLEKKDVTFIKKHKVSIGISLDAATAVANNKSRISAKHGGNFKKAVQALEWFRGYKGLSVITTISKLNVTKLPQLVKFLHSKGVSCVLMNPMRLTSKKSRSLKPDDLVMAKYFIKAVKTALECSLKSKHKIIIGNFSNVILAIVAPSARRLMCDISPCGGGRCFFAITASGDAIPCGEFIGLKKFYGGNIFKNSINSIMNSPSFKQMRSRVVENIPECDICVLRNICGAPCSAELEALGNRHQKSIFCEFYKEVIKFAFDMIAQGKENYFLRPDDLKQFKYQYQI